MGVTVSKAEKMDISAIVLAGGQGARMSYRDKAWVSYLGKPLIMHVIDAIRNQVDDIVISRNLDNDAYEALGYPCFHDQQVPGQQPMGPLSGILACAGAVRSGAVLVVPCDIPGLPANLVSSMLPRLQGKTNVVLSQDTRQLQHLVFIARTECLGSIGPYLENGGRSVAGWLETQACVTQAFGVPFPNINEVQQLR